MGLLLQMKQKLSNTYDFSQQFFPNHQMGQETCPQGTGQWGDAKVGRTQPHHLAAGFQKFQGNLHGAINSRSGLFRLLPKRNHPQTIRAILITAPP